jgi:hypothetical protein
MRVSEPVGLINDARSNRFPRGHGLEQTAMAQLVSVPL